MRSAAVLRRRASVAKTDDERAELMRIRQELVSGQITATGEALFWKYYNRHLAQYEPTKDTYHHD